MILDVPSINEIYLEKIDPNLNMSRYYRLSIERTLFGEWSMVREWGRVGCRGQSREQWCATREEALVLLASHHARRLQRGYR